MPAAQGFPHNKEGEVKTRLTIENRAYPARDAAKTGKKQRDPRSCEPEASTSTLCSCRNAFLLLVGRAAPVQVGAAIAAKSATILGNLIGSDLVLVETYLRLGVRDQLVIVGDHEVNCVFLGRDLPVKFLRQWMPFRVDTNFNE